MGINCYLLTATPKYLESLIKDLRGSSLVSSLEVITNSDKKGDWTNVSYLYGTEVLRLISKSATEDKILIITEAERISLGYRGIERMQQVLTGNIGMVYADYYDESPKGITEHPLVNHQKGSLRDDFDFGSLLCFSSKAFKNAVKRMDIDYKYAGLYDLRLKVSKDYEIYRLQEYLYNLEKVDHRASGKKIFDYVDPKQREVQIEMEQACTLHLRDLNALITSSELEMVDFGASLFKYKATVIIPVRNREKTISDAIDSVLKQQTNFPFNIIVVDNHSTDNTTEILAEYARQNKDVSHCIPMRQDLGIGGCWNEAINHSLCGEFAIQLDSDDLYADEHALQQIVDTFESEKCAMVIGSYKMTNFDLEEIPPGLIDHKEWTDSNGMNNALRINGLGAPRAFYTPIIREVGFPNVSYGEDYAVALAISRTYKIGRIYTPIYLCRRWEDNSDALLSIEKQNAHNFYKDSVRTFELEARLKI